MSLVVNVKNADIIASLLKLKQEVEAISGTTIRMALVGAGESHLLAAELAAANVGVIVTPPRPFPYTWEGRRMSVNSLHMFPITRLMLFYSSIQGPPVTEQSLVTKLFAHGVTVGIGHQGFQEKAEMSTWAASNLRWDAAWVSYSVCDVVQHHDHDIFPRTGTR